MCSPIFLHQWFYRYSNFKLKDNTSSHSHKTIIRLNWQFTSRPSDMDNTKWPSIIIAYDINKMAKITGIDRITIITMGFAILNVYKNINWHRLVADAATAIPHTNMADDSMIMILIYLYTNSINLQWKNQCGTSWKFQFIEQNSSFSSQKKKNEFVFFSFIDYDTFSLRGITEFTALRLI